VGISETVAKKRWTKTKCRRGKEV